VPETYSSLKDDPAQSRPLMGPMAPSEKTWPSHRARSCGRDELVVTQSFSVLEAPFSMQIAIWHRKNARGRRLRKDEILYGLWIFGPRLLRHCICMEENCLFQATQMIP